MTSPMSQDVMQTVTQAIDHMHAAFRARSQVKYFDGMTETEMREAMAYNAPFNATYSRELDLAVETSNRAIELYKQYKQALGLKLYADHRETWDALSDMASAIYWVRTKVDAKVVSSAKWRAEKNYSAFAVEFNRWAL